MSIGGKKVERVIEDDCLLWYGLPYEDDVWNMDRITLNLIVAKNKKG